MNTLVGLGALSSFAVSSMAALIPKLVTLFTNILYFVLVNKCFIYRLEAYTSCDQVLPGLPAWAKYLSIRISSFIQKPFDCLT